MLDAGEIAGFLDVDDAGFEIALADLLANRGNTVDDARLLFASKLSAALDCGVDRLLDAGEIAGFLDVGDASFGIALADLLANRGNPGDDARLLVASKLSAALDCGVDRLLDLCQPPGFWDVDDTGIGGYRRPRPGKRPRSGPALARLLAVSAPWLFMPETKR